MTATTSHIEPENETTMHRTINWMICFALAYGSMVYWWTNSFHFTLLLQQFTPETQQFFENRTNSLNSVQDVNTWWSKLLDIFGPIITGGGVTYVAILMKGLAEEQLKKIKSKKKNK